MLVTMKEILDRASAENYGVAAPNVSGEFDARTYIEVAEELNAPLILDVAFFATSDIESTGRILRDLAIQSKVPVAINLDHGGSKEQVMMAIRAGFTSVMMDRSSSPLEENIAEVKEVVELAHLCGVSVEAELGHVGQANNYAVDRDAALTTVEEAKRYIEETGVDCLAVAIGTAHGAYPDGFVPYLDFDRLVAIKEATGHFPLVLHGSSGTANEDLEKACKLGINKINIATELQQAGYHGIIDAGLTNQTAARTFMKWKDGAKAKLAEKIKVYGSDGKAWMPEFKGLPVRKITFKEK